MIELTEELKLKIIKCASANFLIKELPENWFDYTDSEQIRFIRDHIWEPLEYKNAEEVLELIQDSAYHLQHFLETEGFLKK